MCPISDGLNVGAGQNPRGNLTSRHDRPFAYEASPSLTPERGRQAVLALALHPWSSTHSHDTPPASMPCGRKRKRHKIATHKRKKRLRKNRHKKKNR